MLSSKIYEYWSTTLILGVNYENGNDVLKMINKSSKNKNNELVYMINE